MQPTSKEWVLCSTFWTRPCLLFGILLHGRSFYSLLFFFNNLFISVQTPDIHFILLIIIHYSFILLLKLFQLWPFGSCFCPLTCLCRYRVGWFVLNTSHFGATTCLSCTILGLSCIFPALILESTVSPRSTCSFY